jgi:hypothetical protein
MMRARPKRVLLFRSGRHLQVALDAIDRRWPGALVTVVTSSSGLRLLDQAGVDQRRRIVYDRSSLFAARPFLMSGCFWRALAIRPDVVAVLWSAPDGHGHSNVDRTAMLIAPGGFVAITPDGSVLGRRWAPLLAREAVRCAASFAVDAAIALLLYVPARAARVLRS